MTQALPVIDDQPSALSTEGSYAPSESSVGLPVDLPNFKSPELDSNGSDPFVEPSHPVLLLGRVSTAGEKALLRARDAAQANLQATLQTQKTVEAAAASAQAGIEHALLAARLESERSNLNPDEEGSTKSKEDELRRVSQEVNAARQLVADTHAHLESVGNSFVDKDGKPRISGHASSPALALGRQDSASQSADSLQEQIRVAVEAAHQAQAEAERLRVEVAEARAEAEAAYEAAEAALKEARGKSEIERELEHVHADNAELMAEQEQLRAQLEEARTEAERQAALKADADTMASNHAEAAAKEAQQRAEAELTARDAEEHVRQLEAQLAEAQDELTATVSAMPPPPPPIDVGEVGDDSGKPAKRSTSLMPLSSSSNAKRMLSFGFIRPQSARPAPPSSAPSPRVPDEGVNGAMGAGGGVEEGAAPKSGRRRLRVSSGPIFGRKADRNIKEKETAQPPAEVLSQRILELEVELQAALATRVWRSHESQEQLRQAKETAAMRKRELAIAKERERATLQGRLAVLCRKAASLTRKALRRVRAGCIWFWVGEEEKKPKQRRRRPRSDSERKPTRSRQGSAALPAARPRSYSAIPALN